MKFKALTLAALLPFSAAGQDPPAEIDRLFKAIDGSGCTFNRNGTWYNATEASAHLHRKYEYLAKKGLARSAESFIDQAASKSSISGKPYLVRCGNAAPVPSKSWFLSKLAELRQSSGRR